MPALPTRFDVGAGVGCRDWSAHEPAAGGRRHEADRSAVPVSVRAHVEHGWITAGREDLVGGVGRVATWALGVRRPGEDLVADVVREVQLARQDGIVGVHHEVDVQSAAGIPAGIDGAELDHAGGVGRLAAAQERLVCQVLAARRGLGGDDDGRVGWREARVAAERVALPDLHGRVARRCVAVMGEADAELQRDARRSSTTSRRIGCVSRWYGPSSCSAHDRHTVQLDSIDASSPLTASVRVICW